MTGSERITEKILQDASQAAQALRESADREAALVLEQARTQRDAAGTEAERRADGMIREIEQRSEATRQLELRKRDLTIRQQMVETAFQKAVSALADLPDEAYRTLMLGMMADVAWDGDAELVVSLRDRARLGDDFPGIVDAARANRKLSGKTRYAADSLPSNGGFVVRCGEMEINGTLEVILSGLRPKLEGDVVKVLFEGLR